MTIRGENDECIFVIKKTIGRAEKPLTVEEINDRLPNPFRDNPVRIRKLIRSSLPEEKIYQWPRFRNKDRFWKERPEDYVRTQLLEILSESERMVSEITSELKRRMFGSSQNAVDNLRKKVMKGLLAEKKVMEYPLIKGKRKKRIGIGPPDPSVYLQDVVRAVRDVMKKLVPFGVEHLEIKRAIDDSIGDLLGITFVSDEPKIGLREDVQPVDPETIILEVIPRVEPRAFQSAMVPIPEVRSALSMEKSVFDKAVLELARKERIFLHRHAHPTQLSDDELETMVTDGGGGYFVGIVLRQSRDG